MPKKHNLPVEYIGKGVQNRKLYRYAWLLAQVGVSVEYILGMCLSHELVHTIIAWPNWSDKPATVDEPLTPPWIP